jgi:DNA invertase Pin-like site-specific DNA recombinase
MSGYIGYIRVSTVKQGTTGVSLLEQRDAISRYAERNQFPITIWLEEMETAAKRGRPIFNQALKILRTGKAQGIILHKLDRGARNLRDWAAIGELSDQGVEIHFVNESLDLQSRGGRLSADIQAVVAADFIRNLREETRKGFYGRLKQGLYPLRAPIGYVDQGKGNAKTIDPIKGPLVKKAFELYATARYSLETLGWELYQLGFRNRNGGLVTRNGLSTMLNNPFYIGIIQIQKTSETFIGVHEPIIGKLLFDRVHGVLTGKINTRSKRHNFEFRRMLSCNTCKFSLIGERQKGTVYYRCHNKQCPKNSIREDVVGIEVAQFFQKFNFNEKEVTYFKAKILKLKKTWETQQQDDTRNLNVKLGQIKDRLNRLTDAYLDEALDKAMFEARKKSLLIDQKTTEANLANLARNGSATPTKLENFLELAGNAGLSHAIALPEERRDMVKIFTSNRLVDGKKVDLKPSLPFQEIVNRPPFVYCDQRQDIPRTWDHILDVLTALNSEGLLPDLSMISTLQHGGDVTDPMKDDRDDGSAVLK